MGEVGPVWGGGMVDFGRGGPAYGTFPGEGRGGLQGLEAGKVEGVGTRLKDGG